MPEHLENPVPVLEPRYVEDSGHKWRASDPSYYDHATGEVIFTGYRSTGDEPCEHCGHRYREYSLACQNGVVHPCTMRRAKIDGVIVDGPPS